MASEGRERFHIEMLVIYKPSLLHITIFILLHITIFISNLLHITIFISNIKVDVW